MRSRLEYRQSTLEKLKQDYTVFRVDKDHWHGPHDKDIGPSRGILVLLGPHDGASVLPLLGRNWRTRGSRRRSGYWQPRVCCRTSRRSCFNCRRPSGAPCSRCRCCCSASCMAALPTDGGASYGSSWFVSA